MMTLFLSRPAGLTLCETRHFRVLFCSVAAEENLFIFPTRRELALAPSVRSPPVLSDNGGADVPPPAPTHGRREELDSAIHS